MLLYRAAYKGNKEVAKIADDIVQGKSFSGKVNQKIPVEAGALLLSTLEIGKIPYTNMRGIFKSQIGNPIVPRYELVSGFNTSITPTCQPLQEPYKGIRYPLIPAITTTCLRQLSVLDVDLSQLKNAEVVFKTGFDGSGSHNIFNQKGSADTNNITMAMICPLVIKSDGKIVWNQPRPQSQNTHRPIVLQLGKETIESLKIYGPITREMAEIEDESFCLAVKGHTIQTKVKIRITALDRKASDAVTGVGGAFCDLCFMSEDEAHDLGQLDEPLNMNRTLESTRALAAMLMNEKGDIPTKSGDWDSRFGVMRPPTVEKEVESTQTLHMLLRVTDWVLKLTYHEIACVSHWSEGVNMRDLSFIKQSKQLVQNHMKENTGLKVDYPDSTGKGGTTTSGNTCRRILFHKETREMLLELVPERNRDKLRNILVRLAVALRVVSSKKELIEAKVSEFEVFNRETYKLILRTYPLPQVKMSPSVHKLLGHTWDLIALNDNFALGTVSEGGIEACNKLLRKYRISLSRKTNQQDNLHDCAKRLWVNSDPVLENMRLKALPFCKKCNTRGHSGRYCPEIMNNDTGLEDDLVESFFK